VTSVIKMERQTRFQIRPLRAASRAFGEHGERIGTDGRIRRSGGDRRHRSSTEPASRTGAALAVGVADLVGGTAPVRAYGGALTWHNGVVPVMAMWLLGIAFVAANLRAMPDQELTDPC
jgi:hypothetical protein